MQLNLYSQCYENGTSTINELSIATGQVSDLLRIIDYPDSNRSLDFFSVDAAYPINHVYCFVALRFVVVIFSAPNIAHG